MGCLFNEITRICGKNKVGFIYHNFVVVVGRGAKNRNKKSDMLSVALFLKDKTCLKLYFSVPS